MSMKLITWPKLILFGDSITQFSFNEGSSWGACIADKLQRRCDVVNRGFSGYNTRWNLMILPQIISKDLAKETVATVIFLGANDSNSIEENPRQHVPVEEFQENLKKMVDYLHCAGLDRDRVILIGPPPCHTETWTKKCEAEGKVMAKDNEVTGRYSVACGDAARQSGAAFLDLYTAMMADSNWSRYLNDGLHLSSDGSSFLFERLWPLIAKRVESLPELILPDWKDVDHTNPHASLL